MQSSRTVFQDVLVDDWGNLVILTRSQAAIKAFNLVATYFRLVGQSRDALNSLNDIVKITLIWEE